MADDHRTGQAAVHPFMDLILGIFVYGGAFVVFTILQITATQTVVFGLLQTGIHASPQMTGQQAIDFVNGSLDRSHQIATAISYGVQIAIVGLAFSSNHARQKAAKLYASGASPSVVKSARRMASFETFINIVLIGSDVLTDFLYVAAGYNIFAGTAFGFVPIVSNGGGLIVALMYPLAIISVTLYCGPKAVQHIDAGIRGFMGSHPQAA